MSTLSRKAKHVEKQEHFDKKAKLQQRIKTLLVLSGVGIVLWLFAGGEMGFLSMLQSVKYEKELAKTVAQEDKRSKELDRAIFKLQSDTLYIEQIARTNFGMIGNNEKVFVFPKENSKKNGFKI
jgi:cell division protein FtsB